MPNVNTARTGIAELPKGPPLVVALVGATTGIGVYVAKALAQTFSNHGSKLRVYVVGRKAANAETLFAYGRETSPGSDWKFVQASDLSLISDVDRVSQEIIKQENEDPFAGGPPRLDVLYMSHALSPLQESKRTTEGIDAQMSCLYYSRMRFILNLTPLLHAAPSTAKVISIYAGSVEDAIKPGYDPIGVPSPEEYGITAVRRNVGFMKTFFFEELAEKNAGKISFTHIYPGLVDGPVLYSDVNPLWFRIVWRVMKPLFWLYMTSPQVCGEIMLYLATPRYCAKRTVDSGDKDGPIGGVAFSTQNEIGGGAYGVGQRGDENKGVSYEKVRKDDTARKVWEHTIEVLEKASRSNSTL
ncbi:hypothetical protein GQ44DRAFT_766957 [Phaeosphaeriaceae sp. PMI808]|nr:hypothetical protein GQ44DRAFT_766957 [Phaeosphaeriaceae sp. PMI808]